MLQIRIWEVPIRSAFCIVPYSSRVVHMRRMALKLCGYVLYFRFCLHSRGSAEHPSFRDGILPTKKNR